MGRQPAVASAGQEPAELAALAEVAAQEPAVGKEPAAPLEPAAQPVPAEPEDGEAVATQDRPIRPAPVELSALREGRAEDRPAEAPRPEAYQELEVAARARAE